MAGDDAGVVRALGELWVDALCEDPAIRVGTGDVICSPAGLWLALAAMEAGAEARTRAELRGVIGPAGVEETVARAMGRTGGFFAETTLRSRLPLRPEFRMPLAGFGFGQFDPGLRQGHPALGALVVNAVTLEAQWEQPFYSCDTREQPFTDAQGTVHQVPFMIQEVPVEDAWPAGPDGRVTVIELRAQARGGAASVGMQPVRVRFARAEKGRITRGESPLVTPAELIAASWAPAARGKPVRSRLRHPDAMLLELPRFSLSGEIDVSPHLALLGVERLFSSSAELPRMFAEPMHCDRVVQNCQMRFGEGGIDSETATEVVEDRWWEWSTLDGPGELRKTSPVRLNRPFAVAVLDESATIPLLAAYQASRPGYSHAESPAGARFEAARDRAT